MYAAYFATLFFPQNGKTQKMSRPNQENERWRFFGPVLFPRDMWSRFEVFRSSKIKSSKELFTAKASAPRTSWQTLDAPEKSRRNASGSMQISCAIAGDENLHAFGFLVFKADKIVDEQRENTRGCSLSLFFHAKAHHDHNCFLIPGFLKIVLTSAFFVTLSKFQSF